jgi:isopentenyl-diphosphate delta-isomerase
LKQPVIVKEVGNGISPTIAKKLGKIPIKAIDVAGAGGTSWTAIESKRGNKELGEKFWDVGIPTIPSILGAKKYSKKLVIGSGGVRTGQDILKCMILGCDLTSAAIPIIKQQNKNGVNGIIKHIESLKKEFATGMFLAGAKKVSELEKKDFFLFGKTLDWAVQI